MPIEKAKLLVNFGGEFTRRFGKVSYVGGKTRLVLIDRSVNFEALLSKMSEVTSVLPSCVVFKFQLPDESLDSRLVSVECDDDVVAMISEFDASQRIPVYIFCTSIGSVHRLVGEVKEDGRNKNIKMLVIYLPLASIISKTDEINIFKVDTVRLTNMKGNVGPSVPQEVTNLPNSVQGGDAVLIDPLEFGDAENDLISFPRVGEDIPQASVDSHTTPASELVNGKDSLTVGQIFSDAKAFRDALVITAIALKFELTFIRSDRSRVTAKCAADGCSWRIHASKLPDVETFQIKTLKGDHSCVRPERSFHRQANMKWILSCIMDRVQENVNYKPKEIMRDIEQEYGVIIPYLKAHRAKERALEMIFNMPIKDIVLNRTGVQKQDNAIDDVQDRRGKKPLKGNPVHCNLCKRTGHNRRSCLKLHQTESVADNLNEKNFHCMLCKRNGHNRRTCQTNQAKHFGQ